MKHTVEEKFKQHRLKTNQQIRDLKKDFVRVVDECGRAYGAARRGSEHAEYRFATYESATAAALQNIIKRLEKLEQRK
jgi:hypothetical protein